MPAMEGIVVERDLMMPALDGVLLRRWFDRWLLRSANGVDAEPAVRIFVMGGGSGRRNRDGRLEHGGRWLSAAEWPLPQTRWTRFYLNRERRLTSAPPDAGSPA
jgi:uncharacterized protein